MNTKTTNRAAEREEIEQLLPWHAAGTLGRSDIQRVEDALARDPELRRSYALVRDEFAETIHLNETLGAPSSRAMERLMSGIERHSGPARKARRVSFSVSVRDWFSSLSPRTLTWASAAAATLIVVQAGLLGSRYIADEVPGYRSVDLGPSQNLPPTSESAAPGTYAFIGFVGSATAADITKFLAAHNAVLVDGPRAGGLYRVRLSPNALSKDEVGAVAARLRENRSVVSFIAPTT